MKFADLLIKKDRTAREDEQLHKMALKLHAGADTQNIQSIRMGGTVISPTIGMKLFTSDGRPAVHLQPDADVFMGADLREEKETAFHFFANEQTYNAEIFGEGDIMLGQNDTNVINILWDESAETLCFRSGTTDLLATILLLDSGGAALRARAATSAGLTAILALAATGDIIWLPPATISGDQTVPAGVKVVGASRYASILSGETTLGAASTLENLSIVRSVDSASAHKGVIVGASGTAYLSNCDVEVTNAGAGGAYGVSVDGNGDVECWSCYLYGNSGSGSGYAVYHGGGSGSGYIYGGRAYGTTGSFNV